MSNIQKAFKAKAKRGLCMAAGGVLGTYDSGAPIKAAVMGGGNPADLIQNPTGIQDSPGGGELVVMGHDPMAGLNSLTPNTQTSNRFYGGHLGNDPHFSASTSRVMQERNLGRGGSSGSGYVPAQRNAPAPNLMTPVSDMFQPRRGLQLADGGVVGLIRSRNAAIADAANADSQPAARPAAAPVAAALPSQAADYAAQAAALEAEQLAAARAAAAPKPKQGLMQRLGFAQGGVVRLQGPGTGTSDDIPLTLRTGGQGMDINVSNGEGLAVLPAKTMQHPEAVEAVNDIIETTNGKPPRGLKAGASYADGSAPYKLGSDPELEQKRMVDAGLASPDSTGFGSSVGNSLRRFTVAHSNDPDSVAVRSGTATPEQLQRAKGGMARAMETDSPFDVAAPIAPLGASVKAAVEAAPGVVSRGLSAVRGMLPSFGKSAEPVAAKAAAAPVAEVAAPVAKTLSREAADYLAANAAKDAKFSKAATPAVATSPAGAVGNIPARANVANAVGQTVTSNDARVVTPAATIEPGAYEPAALGPYTVRAPTPAAVADTEKPANDIQVRSIRGANGKMQPEFYGMNVTQTYTGADGKPTTNWYDTQEYKDSQVRVAKDQALLKTYEKWGLEGDLKSNNPAYQARGLARQKAFDENNRTEAEREVAAANRDLQRQELDIRREDLGLRRAQEQRAIAAASRQAQLAAAEEGRKADEATSKKQDNYHKYLESVLTMPLTDSNGNVTNVPDARAIAEFTSKADATVAAMEEATRGTAEHSRWVDPTTKKPKSSADLDDTQKSWVINRYKAYQRIKQAQKGWATLGYADKFDTNDLSLLDGAEEGDYITFPKLKAKLGFVPRIQKKDLAYSDGPIGLTDLQLGKTPYDAYLNNILGR